MDPLTPHRRPAALLAAAALSLMLTPGVGAQADAASTVRFGSMPRQFVKGELAAVWGNEDVIVTADVSEPVVGEEAFVVLFYLETL